MADTTSLMNQERSTSNTPQQKNENDNCEMNLPPINYKWYHFNVGILPAKLSFFFENAKRIGFVPNMVPFLTAIGLNKAQAGFIVGFRLIGMMVGGPFWGMLADRTHAHRIIISIICFFAVIFTCSQSVLSIPYGDSKQNVCPSVTRNVTLSLYNTTTTNSTGRIDETEESFNIGLLLTVMFMINLVACFFEASISSFVDAGVVRRCQLSVDRPVEYGKQRMYASIGAAFGITITNSFVDVFPDAGVTCYAGIFIAYFMFTLLEYLSMMVLYRGLSFRDDGAQSSATKVKEKMTTVLKANLKKYDVLFFYFTVFISGIIYAQYTSFVMVYIKELGATTLLQSISMVVSSLSGVLSFYFAATIIKLAGGTWQTISLAFFCYFVRYMIFFLIKNPWLSLIAQALHAMTGPLTVAASVTHIKNIAPSSIIATMCSIFNTLHYGVGNIVGSSIGGLIYQTYGGNMLFLSSSIIGLIWSVVVAFYIVISRKKTANGGSKENDEVMKLKSGET